MSAFQTRTNICQLTGPSLVPQSSLEAAKPQASWYSESASAEQQLVFCGSCSATALSIGLLPPSIEALFASLT